MEASVAFVAASVAVCCRLSRGRFDRIRAPVFSCNTGRLARGSTSSRAGSHRRIGRFLYVEVWATTVRGVVTEDMGSGMFIFPGEHGEVDKEQGLS